MIFQKSACIETLYTELPFLERFRAAKADGFEFVEFWSWTDKDLAAVKAAADAAGVGMSGTGEIHYPAVFAALEQAGYRGLIGYELFPKTDTKTAVRAIMAD